MGVRQKYDIQRNSTKIWRLCLKKLFDEKRIFTGSRELVLSNKESKAKMINLIGKRLSEASCIVMYAKRDATHCLNSGKGVNGLKCYGDWRRNISSPIFFELSLYYTSSQSSFILVMKQPQITKG